MQTAIQMLETRMRERNTLACVGLDPDLNRIPTSVRAAGMTDEDVVQVFLEGLIDATANYVCAYKAQKAFFDLLSGGHDLLKSIIAYVHWEHPGVPVFVDCKIGDIDNTMAAYMDNLFGLLCADGVIVNPYIGEEVMQATMLYPEKGIIVLCKTSNRGSAITQDVRLESGQMLWEYMLDLTINRWNTAGNMIPVISSTADLDLRRVRTLIPDNMPILFAGIGAQGGSYAQIRDLLNSQNAGVFVNSSRGVLYPEMEQGANWQVEVGLAALSLKNALNEARG